MIRPLVAVCFTLACALASAQETSTPGTPVSAKSPKDGTKVTLRSGEIIPCHVGRGCTEEVADGHRYLVLDYDGFVVKAALDQQEKVSLANLSITNDTDSQVEVKPGGFRLEVSKPKYRRLAALDPDALHRLLDDRPKQVTGKGLPDPSYWTSAKHKEDQAALQAMNASQGSLLRLASIPPHQTVSGKVYFERPPGTTDLSLMVPFSGAILEFPYEGAPTGKKKKARKSEPAGN